MEIPVSLPLGAAEGIKWDVIQCSAHVWHTVGAHQMLVAVYSFYLTGVVSEG